MTFEDLKFDVHPSGDGVRATYQFMNGYGASIIRCELSHGGPAGLFELAVLDRNYNVIYDTPVTNDVEGYLTEEDITNLLQQIESLPPRGYDDPRLFEDGFLA